MNTPSNPVTGPAIQGTVAALALSILLASLGISIVTVALPTFAQAFSTSMGGAQWTILAYLLATTIASVGVGRLGDIVGRRRVLVAGIALFTLASLACALADTLGILIAARAAQGIGAAILMALPISFVRDTMPKARMGTAMGLLGTMSAIGTALGPSIGGVLLSTFGWQSVFLVLIPLGALNAGLSLRYLPAAEQHRVRLKGGFDPAGTLVLGLALAAYALAMTLGAENFGRANWLLLAAALCACGIFLLIETRTASPLVPLWLFRNPAFSASLFMNMLVTTVMMATLVVGPFYLSLGLGLADTTVGLIMAVGPATAALTGIPAGRITDRFGATTIVIVGLIEIVAGALALSFLPGLLGAAGYILALVILTPGFQLFLAANNTAVMMDVDADRRGLVSGLLNLSRNLGFITGASALGAVFAAASGADGIAAAPAEAVSTGMTVTFVVAAALVVSAIGIALAGRLVSARIAGRGIAP